MSPPHSAVHVVSTSFNGHVSNGKAPRSSVPNNVLNFISFFVADTQLYIAKLANQFIHLFFPIVLGLLFSRVHATLQPALSVGRSVRLSVHPSPLTFLALRAVFALLLLPKCLGKPLLSLPLPTRTQEGLPLNFRIRNLFPKYPSGIYSNS